MTQAVRRLVRRHQEKTEKQNALETLKGVNQREAVGPCMLLKNEL